MDRPARLQNSLALMAINAADATITIGTRMSAPIAGLLLLIAKTLKKCGRCRIDCDYAYRRGAVVHENNAS